MKWMDLVVDLREFDEAEQLGDHQKSWRFLFLALPVKEPGEESWKRLVGVTGPKQSPPSTGGGP